VQDVRFSKDREREMVAIIQTIQKLVAAATHHDLTLRQLALLELATDGGTEVRLAATTLALNKPACTRAADRLSEERLLQRKPIIGDRRRALLVATAKGRRLIDRVAALLA
jgi:DNA-binding MarR family transcriptional regulator